MLLPLFASAVMAAASPEGAPPAAPPPSIDSLLESQTGPGTTDTDEEPGTPAPQGPVPYSQFDGKAYDDALRGSAIAARAAAGPLDGGWTLAAADGRRLYRFQFVGHGYGLSDAEGAWRDLGGGARLKGSGFVDQVGYAGEQLTLRFYETSASDEVLVTMKPGANGVWTGELRRGGAVIQVSFHRD